jgi:hypothetical protein
LQRNATYTCQHEEHANYEFRLKFFIEQNSEKNGSEDAISGEHSSDNTSIDAC